MWRFVGFVALVIAGLAAVFYYTGQAEDTKVAQSLRKSEQPQKVPKAIDPAAAPIIKRSEPAGNVGIIRMGGAIIIPAELKPKEEQEVTFEVENANASIEKIFKDIGSEVKPGDPLVKLEDIMPQARYEAQKTTANEVSDSKIESAKNSFEVYDKIVRRNEPLAKQGSYSQQELDLDYARREQARQEIVKAISEKKFEGERLREVTQQLKLYEIRARVNGTIVKVNKKAGSTVRSGEPIMLIVNDKSLIVEGAFESGFSGSLNKGMTVILEPENDREAKFVFNGHTGVVTGLAVAPQGRFMASSSEDGSVVLWDLVSISSLPWLRLERPDQRRIACKSVAISPSVNNDVYQLLAGFADGSIYQWTIKIDGSSIPKVESKAWEKAHDQAVNCISFRGDGNYAASGSDDRRVALWNTSEGKRLYWVQSETNGNGSTHSGAVTSVCFSKDGQFLLTSGTDNAIRRWKLGNAKDGSELVKTAMGRTGDVGRINLADDGRYLFSEHGDELRLLDSRTLEPVSVIGSRRSGRFVQFAQLSPSGQWAVTATDQGRNLLIRMPKLLEPKAEASVAAPKTPTPLKGNDKSASAATPTLPTATASTSTDLWLQDGAIGAQFTLPEAVRATCAVFLTSANNNSFVFLGSTDSKIRIWQLPTAAELTTPILAKLVFKSPQVESGTGLIRVQAEFDNSGARKLETGKRVTMIVYPDATDHK